MFALALTGCGEAPISDSAPDLIFHDATVYTADADSTVAEALAIRRNRLVAVGSNAEVQALAGPDTEVQNLGGRAVIPGLGDGHLHNVGGMEPGVDLSDARTMGELLDAISEAAEMSEEGSLIRTQGNWHEGQLEEQRLPLRDDLDRAAPDHPVVVVRGGHELILNSLALERFGIDRSTPTPEGGRIGRYDDGRLNGELVDAAARRLVDLPEEGPETVEDWVERFTEEHQVLNRSGITSVRYAIGSPTQWKALRELRDRGKLTVRASMLFPLFNPPHGAALDSVISSWGVEPGQGNDWLKVGGVKMGVDGGYEGGLMREPYREPYGEDGSYHGLQTTDTETFARAVEEVSRRGWRVATHAVGDSAMDVVLHGYRAADSVRSLEGRRWAIEHAFIPREDHFPVMRELELVASLQNHLYVAAPSLVDYWSRERAERVTPVRLFLDSDIPVAAGSDASTNPHDPFWVMYHFVTRGTITAGVMGEEFGITRREALRAATWGNAYLAFAEDERGTIEEGKLADLVVLSNDIMDVPPEELKQTEALLTVVGGRVVYDAGKLSR